MNVVVVRQDNNGDVLLAGPAIRAIAVKAARISLVCGPSGYAAARTLPHIDSAIVFEAAWIEANPAPLDSTLVHEFIERIRIEAFDEAVIFTSFHQSPLPMALLLRLANVPKISGISDDFAGSLLDLRHRVSDNIHEVERALSLAAAAGYVLGPDDERRLAMRIGDTNPFENFRPYIVVHPGATVPARAWMPEKNRALVRALVERGTRVIVTGSAAEAELCSYVADEYGINACGTTDFSGLARVISDAQAIVVGNTGAAHVAAAVGTPVVSIFAPTIPSVRFHPWKVAYRTLGNQDIACAGCRARICPLENQPCVSSVTLDDALDALWALCEPPLVSEVVA